MAERTEASLAARLLSGPGALLRLAAAAVVLRAAGLVMGLVNIDECDFWLFGRMVGQGARPYVDVADIKPPLTYLAFTAADLLSGHRFRLGVPLLGLAAVLGTALLLRAAARRWTGDPRAGWAAAWLTLWAGLCESPAVNAELLMNVPAAGALWALVRAHREGRWRWWGLAGAMAALATLFKLQAGILLVAFAGSALLEGARSLVRPGPEVGQAPADRSAASGPISASSASASSASASSASAPLASSAPALASPFPASPFPAGPAAARASGPVARSTLPALAALGAGYALPGALTVAAFAALRALPELYDWVVWRNVFQIGKAQVFSLGNVLPSIAAALLGAAFAWLLALRGAGRPGDATRRALVLLLLLTVVPVSVGRRFYEHYFLQFVPPLALLGASELVRLVDGWPSLAPRLRRLALVLAALPPLAYLAFTAGRGLAGGYPGQEPRTRAIAAWLRQHTAPGERVFLWGDYSPVYCLANRLPGTRYIRTAPLVGDFDPLHLPPGFDFVPFTSRRDVALALRDLAARRPEVVVDTAAADLHRWSLFPLARVPDLDRYLQEHYAPVARPGGAVVYRRRDGGPPPSLAGVDDGRPR